MFIETMAESQQGQQQPTSSPLSSVPPSPQNVPTQLPTLFQEDTTHPNPAFSSLFPLWYQNQVVRGFRTPSPLPNPVLLPPSSGADSRDGMEPCSPIRGRTQAQKRAHKISKREQKKRQQEERLAEERAAKKARIEAEAAAKAKHLDEAIRRIFQLMNEEKIHLGDFMEHVFGTDFHDNHSRYLNFF